MIVVEECQISRQLSSLNARLPILKEAGIGYYKGRKVYMVSAMLDIKLTAKPPLAALYGLASLAMMQRKRPPEVPKELNGAYLA